MILLDWIWTQDTIQPIHNHIDHTLADQVVETVESLSKRDREILEMRYWERLTYQQIANRLGKNSRGAAKYHVGKAERHFKQKFEKVFSDYERERSTRQNL